MSFENNKPHVNFEINKEMDYWTVGEFLSFNPSDSISNSILLGYPGLKKAKHLNNDERITYYKNYIDHIYNDQELKIADIRKKTQKSWNKVEKKFLDNTAKLFNGHPWPEGAYVGFLSIFNCGPRLLNEKIFQVYYKHKEGLVYACAHEMMHFMFYDYLEKNPDLSRNISDSVIWDLSEIFNIVVLERPEFVEITGNPHPRPYEKHETQISKFRKLMKRSKNIDDMIKESFRLLVQ